MLLEDFIEQIYLKCKQSTVRPDLFEDLDNDDYSWSMPNLDHLAKEDMEDNYKRMFVEAYFNRNSSYPDGKEGHIHVAQCVKDMGEYLYEITYNKTGKKAAIQYYLANGNNEVSYVGHIANDGWMPQSESDKNFTKFIGNLKIRENLKATHLVYITSERSTDIIVEGNAITTPPEGFRVHGDMAVEFEELLRLPHLLRANRKWVENGVSKGSEIITAQVADGQVLVERTPMEEDWWGLHIPDFKIPFFKYATPFNKSIHKYLYQPEYAGKNIWVVRNAGTSNTEMLVKVGETWIPIHNPEKWDLAGLVNQEVAEEYALFKSLME